MQEMSTHVWKDVEDYRMWENDIVFHSNLVNTCTY